MKLQNRVKSLEVEFHVVHRPLVLIYRNERMVKLNDGREMTIDKYKSLVEAGEISEDRKEIFIRIVR